MTAAAPMGMKQFMVLNLHGTREARRCGIDGNAARTVSSVSRGAWSGSASSQSAIRGSKSGRIVSLVMRMSPRTVSRPSLVQARSAAVGPRNEVGTARSLRESPASPRSPSADSRGGDGARRPPDAPVRAGGKPISSSSRLATERATSGLTRSVVRRRTRAVQRRSARPPRSRRGRPADGATPRSVRVAECGKVSPRAQQSPAARRPERDGGHEGCGRQGRSSGRPTRSRASWRTPRRSPRPARSDEFHPWHRWLPHPSRPVWPLHRVWSRPGSKRSVGHVKGDRPTV